MSSVRGEGDNGSLWEAGSGVGGEQEALITRSKFRRLGGKQEGWRREESRKWWTVFSLDLTAGKETLFLWDNKCSTHTALVAVAALPHTYGGLVGFFCFFLFFSECIQAMITLTSARGREQRESHGLITALITTCSRADGGLLSVTSCEERVSGIEQHETGSRKKNNNKQTNNKGSLCCTRSCQYF